MENILYVYFDWDKSPVLLGRLFVNVNRGKEAFSFEYDKNWIQMCEMGDFPNVRLDPETRFKRIMEKNSL